MFAMTKLVAVFLLMAALSGCKKDSGQAEASDPLNGTYFSWSDPLITIITFSSGKLEITEGYVPSGLSRNSAYVRYIEGQYTRNGDTITFAYSERTCGSLEPKSFTLTANNPKSYIALAAGGSAAIFKNENAHSYPYWYDDVSQITLDSECNKFPE